MKSITVLIGTVMLLSCKNDIKEVHDLTAVKETPEMIGEGLILTYSDSAKVIYKLFTPEYIKMTEGREKYEEFPKGVYIINYDMAGNVVVTIKAKYAKKKEDDMIWVARDEVVVTNKGGNKLETELMYWDTRKKIIYSDRYTRLTTEGKIIEGNDGFESDDNLTNPVVKNVTGVVEVEKP